MGIAFERSRYDAQVGEPTDERIGGSFEDKCGERPGWVSRQLLLARCIRRDARSDVRRRRTVGNKRIEELRDADVLRRGTDEDRIQRTAGDALLDRRGQFFRTQLIALEIFRHDVVVSLTRRFNQLLARRFN